MTRDREPSATLPWWWNASLIALGLAMALFRLIPTEADPDLWGHLRFGLDTLSGGAIVRADIYSYLSGLTGPGHGPGAYAWINHEWLAEAIMALAWNAAGAGAGAGSGSGAAGLVAVKVMLGLAVAIVVCRHLIARDVPLLGALLMTAYGMAVILPGLRSLRPQAFTYLAFALLLVWIHRASRGRIAWLALAPPLMAAWANLHGGFVAGLGVLGVWVVADAFRRRGRPTVALAIFAASAAATLATPYGWALWSFLARTLGPRPEIAEWQAVSLVTVQGLAYLAVAAAGVTGLFLTRRERLPIDIMLIVCAVLLPFVAQRHLPLTVLIVFVIGGEHIASAAPVIVRRLTARPSAAPDSAAHMRPDTSADLALQEPGRRTARQELRDGIAVENRSTDPAPQTRGENPASQARSKRAAAYEHGEAAPQKRNSDAASQTRGAGASPQGRDESAQHQRGDRFRPLVAAALLVETCVLLVLIVRSPTTGQITYNSGEYPVEAAARLAEFAGAGASANVAVDFNWGEYVIWHAGPRVKVSMDGRRETVYSDAVYHDNTLFFDGVDDWDRLLQRRPGASRAETDLALVPAGTAVYHLMSLHPDWELVMESGPAALFSRRGGPVTSHLHAIPARALGGDTTLIFP